ncbi:uncharacterized protein BDR25DRAFT_310686 [Lindgomyces ingoldianus]|uniref:Uncharacterized protein n=1 Tax=Lindgomyces ingoldianus TaxID=673940 RepID=A0ACB6R7Z5_9PLEO|nr:uncharacterized protein BDR25DRAFT_310686 [Lindgomyces ingoldianus]KAF2475271.1 hypothetical protein BDR25DRAFT_310686 [Lindgomyces ingoldianus]
MGLFRKSKPAVTRASNGPYYGPYKVNRNGHVFSTNVPSSYNYVSRNSYDTYTYLSSSLLPQNRPIVQYYASLEALAVTTSSDPLVTYHISQNLSGKLNVTSESLNSYSYSITLSVKKAWRDTIEVAIHRSIYSTFQQHGDVVGHCLIQTVQGKFLECKFDAYGTDITLDRSGSNTNMNKSTYALSVPGLGKYKWMHDLESITGVDRRLKLVDEQSGAVLARFGGSQKGISEFGVLEVYDYKVTGDQDWCGLLILTAVCVFAREERSREKRKKVGSVAGAVGNWGGLLTMGVPMGN